MNLLKKISIVFVVVITCVACEPQNEVDGNTDNYVDDRLQGTWQSFDNTYTYGHRQLSTFTISGSEITWCRPANPSTNEEAYYYYSGTIGKDSITYESPYSYGPNNITTPYSLEGDSLRISNRHSEEYIFVQDSDFNPCDGNINNSSFQFRIVWDGHPPQEFDLSVNNVKLFDETRPRSESWECAYSLTPDINYEIDIKLTFKYCPSLECGFPDSPSMAVKTIRKTLKLTQLQNTICNEITLRKLNTQGDIHISETTSGELENYIRYR